MKIESAIEVLSEILGSREEVIAVVSVVLLSDCDFTDKQRMEILREIKRLHESGQTLQVSQSRTVMDKYCD